MIPTTNSTRRFALTAAAAATLAVTASGCGAIVERVTEEAVEQAVEAEGGGDVEIDFDSDSGTFSVEGSDGDATFSLDEDGLTIEGTDADGNDFSLEADESGINAEGADGESFDIDGDGTFTATDADGDVTTGEVDPESGEVVIESEDGESVFRTGTEIPDEWPSDVPQPQGLSNVSSSYQSDGGSVFIIIGGETSDSVDDVATGYIGALESAGFEQESIFESNDARGGTFTRGDENVAINVADLGGTTQISLTYAR